MKRILKILKGALIGLGSILPGVSGGMIAAAFNVYEDLINALDTFTKKPIKAVLLIYRNSLRVLSNRDSVKTLPATYNNAFSRIYYWWYT